MDSKFALKSKSIIGGLVMLVGFLAQMGVLLPFGSEELEKGLGALAEGIGFILLVIGRAKAQGGIHFFKKPE